MVPLVVASILSLAVILERWRYWRRFRQHESGERVLALVAEGHLTQALQMARASAHPVARVLLAGLEHPSPAPGMVMQAAAQAAVRHLKRYLPMLDTIITLAPLLGLLGTITGMISAFGIVSDAGLGQPHAITGGVARGAHRHRLRALRGHYGASAVQLFSRENGSARRPPGGTGHTPGSAPPGKSDTGGALSHAHAP